MTASDIRHIILDLGDVLFEIRTEEEWYENYMLPLVGEAFNKEVFQRFYDEMEHGAYGPDEFKSKVESLSPNSFTTEQFEQAWNERLLDMPVENMEVVLQLADKYQVYLLSNTNEIHHRFWWNKIKENFGESTFESAFQGLFYSHKLGVMKPDNKIYEKVHQSIGEPEKQCCIFFDDSPANVNAAIEFGWQSTVVKNNLGEVVSNLGLL